MKTLGIVGGIAPESTIEYYRFAYAEYRARVTDGTLASIIINSIDINRLLGLVAAGKLDELTRWLVEEVCRLAAAGAHLGLLAANTPHIVFDELRKASPIPLVSIVEASCDEAARLGLKRVGLFGTRFTMQGLFFPQVFSRRGIEIVLPRDDELAYVHQKYTSELLNVIFLPETRERLIAIAQRMKADEGIQGLVLAGTELPLLLRGFDDPELPFLDTTRIHVRAAIEQLLA